MSAAGIMNRTPAGEALRRVNQANTWYARLVEKNRQAEAEYREKIARLEAEYTELQEAETMNKIAEVMTLEETALEGRDMNDVESRLANSNGDVIYIFKDGTRSAVISAQEAESK